MYLVKFSDNTETAVDIRQSSTRRGRWEAHLPNGKVLHLTMKGKNDNGDYVIAINDLDTTVALRATTRGYELTQDIYSEVVSVRRAADIVFDETQSAKGTSPAAEIELQSPITGIVLDVFVSVGMTVDAGAPLVLIEAMKMENTLEAQGKRQIAEVLVKAGDTVFVGDPLVRFEPIVTEEPTNE